MSVKYTSRSEIRLTARIHSYEAADQSQPEATEMDEALSALTQIQLSLDEVRESHPWRQPAFLTPNLMLGAWQMDASKTPIQAAKILSGLGFTQEMMDSPFSSLSGGWRSRCSLAISLLIQSDVLLLDEPSNYLVSRRHRLTLRTSYPRADSL